MVILTERGPVIIDTGNEPADGEALVDFIGRGKYEALLVVLTHGHGDHIFGRPAFGGGCVEVVATRAACEAIRRQRDVYARRFGSPPGPSALIAPTMTFEGRLMIVCGDCSVELFATPGHSPDGLCVYVPEKKTLICGDTVVTAIPVAINDGDGRRLESSIRRLLDYDAELLIPGHGPALRGRREIREWLRFIAHYLAAVREGVRRVLADGGSVDDALRDLPFDDLIGSRLAKDRYKMERRHHDVIKKVFSEEVL